ncbi:MAG: rhodanese-like domain-containing protein [Anaerolineae bacterium]|nr:rhodanese-like domain-containing protein [Anaerolineae bacterium]
MVNRMRWLVLGLVLVTVIAAGCAPATQQAEALPAVISPQDAVSMLAEDDNVVLLDVRTQQEWDIDGHSPDATLIPLDQLGRRVNELEKDDTIVVVCRSGNRSQTAAEFLRAQGFSRVTEVQAGMQNWAAQGLPLECAVEVCAFAP